jgi:phenylpropionate dioxygenase-like ring-hydroxylating dioxygenase large terminal subunit
MAAYTTNKTATGTSEHRLLSIDPSDLIRDGKVHSDIYTSREIFDLELDRIFNRAWLYVGHESEVPTEGDFQRRILGRNPVIMVRGSDGIVRVLMNRCRHRGTTVCELPKGNTKNFRCWFHGWTYDTTGKLIHVNGKEAYDESFRFEDFGLTPAARVDSYRGFIFASLASTGKSLRDHLGLAAGMIDIAIDVSPVGEIAVDQGVSRTLFKGNWKMVGMDGYHADILHASVAQIIARRRNKQDVAAGKAISSGETQYRDSWGSEGDGNPMLATRVLHGGHVMLDKFKERLHAVDRRISELKALRGGAEYIDAMTKAYGEKRARELLAYNGDPHIGIYPNLQLITTHVRVIHPIAPDMTQVDYYPIRIVGVGDEINEHRLRQHEFFYGPAGTVAPDDTEIFERAQVGLMAGANPWIDMRRGMGKEGRDEDGSLIGGITHELTQRGQLQAWADFMAASTNEGAFHGPQK